MKLLRPWTGLVYEDHIERMLTYIQNQTQEIEDTWRPLSDDRADARVVAHQALVKTDRYPVYVLTLHEAKRSYEHVTEARLPFIVSDAILGLIAGDKIIPEAFHILTNPLSKRSRIALELRRG